MNTWNLRYLLLSHSIHVSVVQNINLSAATDTRFTKYAHYRRDFQKTLLSLMTFVILVMSKPFRSLGGSNNFCPNDINHPHDYTVSQIRKPHGIFLTTWYFHITGSRTQATHCGLCGEHSGTDVGCYPSTFVVSFQYHSTNDLYSYHRLLPTA
jgi:hypothetical protein